MRYFKTKRVMALLMCMLLAVGVVFTGNIVLGAEKSISDENAAYMEGEYTYISRQENWVYNSENLVQADIAAEGSSEETSENISEMSETSSEIPENTSETSEISEVPENTSETSEISEVPENTSETSEISEISESTSEEVQEASDIPDAEGEEVEEVSDAITENLVVTSSLVIDGYYADWDKYPTTNITYMSNNAYQVHKGKIYSDGEMVYVHFSMNDLYTSQIMMQQMTITVNGQSHAIGLYPVNADKSINWGYPMYNLSEGIHTNFGVIVDYTKYCDSKAAITVYDASHSPDTKGDEVEFAFSIEDFCRITGMKADSFGNITIVNPNIGSEGVVWAGTPTGIVMGMAVAVVFALLGYSLNKKNRKQENV